MGVTDQQSNRSECWFLGPEANSGAADIQLRATSPKLFRGSPLDCDRVGSDNGTVRARRMMSGLRVRVTFKEKPHLALRRRRFSGRHGIRLAPAAQERAMNRTPFSAIAIIAASLAVLGGMALGGRRTGSR